jgi:hypothetical protein
MREFNKREWSVRIDKSFNSFEDYVERGYEHREEYGVGFVVDGKPVPYFHPNRSFHDEIIWLNKNLYYNLDVSYGDKLVNSAIIKFYGPSRTLDIITGFAEDLPYVKKTDYPYINFSRMHADEEYAYTLMSNIELAFAEKEKIWGTTELRVSLQGAARDHARKFPSVVDRLGVKNSLSNKVVVPKNSDSSSRSMRPSDMIHWIKYMTFPHEENGAMNPGFIDYYKTKPSMEESFKYLTLKRGIGNYYGYHFSSNLARMPGVGSSALIEAEWKSEYQKLRSVDKSLSHGNLDENSDYVVAGPGACSTLKELWPDAPINQKTTMKMIVAIRDRQEEFFGMSTPESKRHLLESSELGKFTTFGIEISCCQFSVFTRLINNPVMAQNRANAPISKEVESSKKVTLEDFF